MDTNLTYCHDAQNPQLIIREDDDFYGSQWSDMMEILDLIHGVEMTDNLYGCYDNFFDSYLNGLPLKDQCNIDLVFPQPISFCYSFCELCNHQHYSIPDIMRMTTYHIRQEVILDETLDMNWMQK